MLSCFHSSQCNILSFVFSVTNKLIISSVINTWKKMELLTELNDKFNGPEIYQSLQVVGDYIIPEYLH